MCPSDQLLNAVQSAVLPQCQHVIALHLELGNFLAPPLYQINPQEQGVCVYAAYLPNRRHSRKVQAFLDFLQLHLVGAAAE